MERELNDLALWKQSLKLRLAAQAERLVAHIEDLPKPVTPLEAERMCEDYELYRVQVFDGDTVVREIEVSTAAWVYAERATDFPGGFGADARVEIAQKSQVYGYGPVLSLALG